MKRIVALLLATMMVLSGCGSSSKPEGNTEATSGNNSLTIAIGAELTTLDPGLNTETINNDILVHTTAGLFRKNTDGVIENDLCESYDMSKDGLVYTFKIVKDAKWSDGKDVTAQDFVYSYLRALSYGADNAWAVNDFLNFVKGAAEYNEAALKAGNSFDCTKEDASKVGFKAIDDKTLEITLKTPCTYLTGLMSANVWIPVREDFAPQHESLWAFEVGYPTCGAYELTECNETEKATIKKNENYIHADQITVEEMTFLCMPAQDAQEMAYQSGEIDVALGISSETAANYKDSNELWSLTKSSSYFLPMNSGSTGPKWAKDPDVRRALALAIDKDTLVDVIGGSLFYPVLNGYVPAGVPGKDGKEFRAEQDEKGTYLKYDQKKAKELLAKAGYTESNPLKITYKYSNNGIHGDVATVLEQMWTAVGIEVNMQCVESGVYYDQLDQGDFEICRYGYSAGDSAMQFLELWTTQMQVVAAIDDAKLNSMCDEARKIVDYNEYIDALHEIENYMVDDNVYLIPLFNFNEPALVKDYVSGSEMTGLYPFFGHATIQ